MITCHLPGTAVASIIAPMSVYLPAKRPLSVTLVWGGVILFGVWNVSKAVLLMQSRPVLDSFSIRPEPFWQAVWALVWAALFLGGAWQLRRRRPLTQFTIPLLLLLFGLYTVGLRLIFSPLPFAVNGGFVITIFFLTVVLLAFLALRRAGRRHYFQEERVEIGD